jgi:lipopolysaccharide/colanic/teichoic acid biosynthesis glycosyltransferase
MVTDGAGSDVVHGRTLPVAHHEAPTAFTSADHRSGVSARWRAAALVGVDLLSTVAILSLARGAITSRVVLISLLASFVLVCVGATSASWNRELPVSARLCRLVFASVISLWLAAGIISVFQPIEDTEQLFIASLALPIVWLLIRAAADGWLKPAPPRVLVVGPTDSCEDFLAACARAGDPHHDLLGYLDGCAGDENGAVSAARIGNLDLLDDMLASGAVDRVVVVGPPAISAEEFIRITRACDRARTELDIASGSFAGTSEKARLSFQNGIPLLRVREPAAPAWHHAVKQSFDAAAAAGALLVLSPLLGLVSLAALLSHGRPLLFRQTRVGRGGRDFAIVKFRTMAADTEDRTRAIAEGVAAEHRSISHAVSRIKSDSGCHLTRLGGFLRRTSFDELPQLWNVLRGDMSLVGPRPLRRFEHESLEPWLAAQRTSVRPGLTGLWQVRGRSEVTWAERINLDHAHVCNWSLRSDFAMLVDTVPAVLTGR